MKLKNTLLIACTVFSFAFAKAQQPSQCAQDLSIFAENAKSKNYTEAYQQLGPLMEKCPDASPALYQYGEIIYENRLKKKQGDEKENVTGLLQMLNTQINKYSDKVNVSRKKIEIARLMYKYDVGTQEEQFNMLNDVFTQDKKNFTDPNGMMTYFKLAEKQFKANQLDLQKLFNIYDELTANIEQLQDERSKIVSDLINKQNDGAITKKEEMQIKNQEKNLKNYGIVMGSVNGTLGELADCDKLIPLYDAEFESNKNDAGWLSNVLVRLQKKDCTDAPLYIKSVKALHAINPSAKTAYGLGNIAKTTDEQFKYWDQAIELGISNDTKANIYYKKGNVYKSKGQFGSAKREYLKATDARPSFGQPYLKIASMVAGSTGSCGANPFEKRAINWVAARYANKAGRVDPSLKSTAAKYVASYNGTAPSKTDIFSNPNYKSGDRITFNCWIGESVIIP